jgi:hypothetical protein
VSASWHNLQARVFYLPQQAHVYNLMQQAHVNNLMQQAHVYNLMSSTRRLALTTDLQCCNVVQVRGDVVARAEESRVAQDLAKVAQEAKRVGGVSVGKQALHAVKDAMVSAASHVSLRPCPPPLTTPKMTKMTYVPVPPLRHVMPGGPASGGSEACVSTLAYV